MKGIAILGSTGSIGTSALEVIDTLPDGFRVIGLAAGRNLRLLAKQIQQYRPSIVSVSHSGDVDPLGEILARASIDKPKIVSGPQGASAIAAHDDVSLVLTAMVGAVGLEPTLTAIRRGITVAIANKEPLVVAGKLCTEEARKHKATLIPVDSEHSAIHQCLAGNCIESVRRLLLTCSGGPFRNTEDLSCVTLDQTLNHPTWSMGPKITVDSATLMNKGLEVIEAHWLFGLPSEQIEVIIHPQSVIHSLVEFKDGSTLAQMGTPDMRVPIAYALSFPERLSLPWPGLDWGQLKELTFEAPDRNRFPCLSLAYDALKIGGTCPAVLNAANEIAVEAFLERKIRFLDIPTLIQSTMETHEPEEGTDLERILAIDRWARNRTLSTLKNFSAKKATAT
ncbi:MAG: 1-deoxy-D-xylulose-5-phosphate reductoisomerase [Pseudomonadota bacterium]